jgi:hypothetical protein
MTKRAEKIVPIPAIHPSQEASLRAKLAAMHVKERWPPRILPKACRRLNGELPARVLIAILDTVFGEHLSELYDDYRLMCVKHGVYSASYYVLSVPQAHEISAFYEALKSAR